jgi:mRNA-degrading endonuclease toxin of MazEF toxin-antitoxin module
MDGIRRGDIWTVELLSHPKPRPALIVSINAVNDLCPDVLVIPITSHVGALRVLLPDAPDMTGLRTASYAKCESLGPLHKARLKRRIGSLPSESWDAVETGMRRVLGLRT